MEKTTELKGFMSKALKSSGLKSVVEIFSRSEQSEKPDERPLVTYLAHGGKEYLASIDLEDERKQLFMKDPQEEITFEFGDMYGVKVSVLGKDFDKMVFHNVSKLDWDGDVGQKVWVESNEHGSYNILRFNKIVGLTVERETKIENGISVKHLLSPSQLLSEVRSLQKEIEDQKRDYSKDLSPIIFNPSNQTYLHNQQRFGLDQENVVKYPSPGIAFVVEEIHPDSNNNYSLSNVTEIHFGAYLREGGKGVRFKSEHHKQETEVKNELLKGDLISLHSQTLNSYFKGEEMLYEKRNKLDLDWRLSYNASDKALKVGEEILSLDENQRISIPSEHGANLSFFSAGIDKPILRLNNITVIEWPGLQSQNEGVNANFISKVWDFSTTIPVSAISEIQTKEVSTQMENGFSEDLRQIRVQKPEQAVMAKQGLEKEQTPSMGV